jgi:hypothetical protein
MYVFVYILFDFDADNYIYNDSLQCLNIQAMNRS